MSTKKQKIAVPVSQLSLQLLEPGQFDLTGAEVFAPSVAPSLNEPATSRSWGEAAKDTGLGVMSGLAGLVKTGGDLYGLATGDMDNAASRLGREGQEYWEEGQSQVLKDKKVKRKQAIDAADGVGGKFLAAARETLTDPSLFFDTIAENASSIIPGMAAGRAAAGINMARGLTAARAVGPITQAAELAVAKTAAKWGTRTAIGAGGVQQGADVAGDVYRDAMRKTPQELAQNPDFVARVTGLMQAGAPEQEAVATAQHEVALSAARAALPAATAISLVANGLPGASMLERAMVGGAARDTIKAGTKMALPKAIAKGALGEGAQETIEEGGGAFAGNVAKREFVDPNQALDEGVGENAGLGFAGGVAMGGAGGAFHREGHQPAPGDKVRDEKVPEVGPLSRAANQAVETVAQQVDEDHAQVQATQAAVAALTPSLPDVAQNSPIEPASPPLSADPETGEIPQAPGEVASSFASSQPPAAPAPRASFGSYDEAADYLAQQRRAHGSLPGGRWLPAEGEGGQFELVNEREPRFKDAETLKARKDIEALGLLPDDILNKSGKPFTNRGAATQAQRRLGIDTHDVVQLGEGAAYVVRPRAAAVEAPAKSPTAAPASPTETPAAAPAPSTAGNGSIAGEPIDAEWTAFTPESGTLGIPRAEMPQIKAEHRGAMVNFLNARGISHEQVEIPAGELKPTQAEFAPAKVEKAKAYEGGDRSILVSSDGHVLDGHHQWMGKRDGDEPVKAIRLNAPIKQLLAEVKEFPSAETAEGATAAPAAEAAERDWSKASPDEVAGEINRLTSESRRLHALQLTQALDSDERTETLREYDAIDNRVRSLYKLLPDEKLEQEEEQSDEFEVPENWQGSMYQARVYAKHLGIEVAGKELPDLVRDIKKATKPAAPAPKPGSEADMASRWAGLKPATRRARLLASGFKKSDSERVKELAATDWTALPEPVQVALADAITNPKQGAKKPHVPTPEQAAEEAAPQGAAPSPAPAADEVAAPAPLEITSGAERRDASRAEWGEYTQADPTAAEFAAAFELVKPGMLLNTEYGSAVDNEVVRVEKGEPGEYDDWTENRTTLVVKDQARKRGAESRHTVFARDGKLYDFEPNEEEGHPRIYVLDGPMGIGAEYEAQLAEQKAKGALKKPAQDGQQDELDGEMAAYEAGRNGKTRATDRAKVADSGKKAELSEQEKAAKAKMLSAAADLAALLSKSTRLNITPEQEQQMLPIVIRLFEGAMELGHVKFKQAARYVREFIASAIDQDAADAIPIDTLQGAYIATARRHADKEITPKKDVIAVESVDELTETEALAEPGPAAQNEPQQEEKPNERATAGEPDAGALDEVPAAASAEPEGAGPVGGDAASQGQDGDGGVPDADAKRVPRARSGGSGDAPVRAARSGAGRAGGRGRRASADRANVLAESPAEAASKPNIPAADYRITADTQLGRGGEVEKFNDNLAAIRIVKTLEAEGRRATPSEQRALARYVGWGGLASAFPNPLTGEFKDKWKERGEELRDLLTKQEYDAARQSTRNAHYTSGLVVNAMWQAAQRLGFKGGLALESSMGTGNFLGLTPEALQGGTKFVGVEFDGLTSRIAAALYPQATVLHSGFQKVPLPDNAFALAIGNPPFGSESLRFQYKPELSGVSIHNQFFRASLDAVRPGGLQIMVVSRFLMDAQDKSSRLALAEKADLVAAIRLPDTAFKENARTEVVTDIIILRKRSEAEQADMRAAIEASRAKQGKDAQAERERRALADKVPAWVGVVPMRDPLGGEPMTVNQYFRANPDMVMGAMERSGSMQHGADITVRLDDPKALEGMLREAIAKLPENVVDIADEVLASTAERHKSMSDALRIALAGEEPGHLKFDEDGKLHRVVERETPEGGIEFSRQEITPASPWSESLYLDAKGRWYRLSPVLDEQGNPVKKMGKNGKPSKLNVYDREVLGGDDKVPESLRLGAAKFERLGAMVRLRDLLKRQLVLETEDAAKGVMEAHRAKLAKAYEAFVAEHGFINRPVNGNLVSSMPDGALVLALEVGYRPEVTAKQAADSGQEASPESATPAPILRERVVPKYEPATSAATPADALVITLAERGVVDMERIASLLGKTQEQAIEALQAGEKPLVFKDPESNRWETANAYLSGQVKRKLNAAKAARMEANVRALEAVQPEPWTAENVNVTLGASWVPPSVYGDFLEHLTGKAASVRFSAITNTFTVANASSNTEKAKDWNSPGAPVAYIVGRMLNSQAVVVTTTDENGNTVQDRENTALAQVKAKEIASEFGDWVFKDGARRALLVEQFNEKFNTRVLRQHDGSHLTLPGKVPDTIIQMRRHQKNAIWRGISERFMLLDHVVGAGKTFTAIARAMERRRMGLSRKPMMAVPNHLVEQFAADVYRLYPGAKVLAAGQQDFEAKRRRRLFAKIATGDWDIVIVPHSSFGFIGIAPETEQRFLEAEMAAAVEAVKDAEAQAEEDGQSGRRKPFGVKEAERLVTKIQERMDRLNEKQRDRLLTFEQLGVDDLTVDEAHEFKNLFYSSRLTGVRGMGNKTGSKKAADLYNKVRVLADTPTGTVTFMTGTPISNSAVEMFTMMRYLAARELDELGLSHFDAWRSQYVEASTKFEPTESGRLKEVNRLGRSWSNMRSLMDMYYGFTDAVSLADIQKWFAEDNGGKAFPVPKVKGGDRQLVAIKPTPAQEGMLKAILEGFDSLDDIKDPYERNIARLRLMDQARKVSLDVRAVSPGANSTEAGGKLERVSDEVARIYKATAADKGTQLIFLDRSVPKAKGDDARLKDYDKAVARRDAALAAEDESAFQDALEALEKFDANEMDELRAAQGGGWNAYQQIKDNLVARGIPAHEVRFVQEAATDAQKQALFDAVNAGRVRVLLGSTPRMGAGTNVQALLVGLHHVDVTWKPSDIEQREGRIIRQGNKLLAKYGDKFEVELFAYATERTVDAKMWDLNATKLKTINGIRNYDGAFTMEFEDEDSVSMAEMAALASGNPLLLERVTLESQIATLELLERAHRRKLFGLQDAVDSAEDVIARNPGRISVAEERSTVFQQRLDDLTERRAARKVTIEGKAYGSVMEAERAAIEAVKAQQDGNDKARYAITIDGARVTNKDAISEAIMGALGDVTAFEAEVGGQVFTQRQPLARLIAEKVSDARVKRGEQGSIKLGTMLGWDLEADIDVSQLGQVEVSLSLNQDGRVMAIGHSASFEDGQRMTPQNARNMLGRLDEDVFDKSSKTRIEGLRRELDRAKQSLPDAKARLEQAREWPKAAEMAAKRARLEKVISKLLGAGGPDTQTVVDDFGNEAQGEQRRETASDDLGGEYSPAVVHEPDSGYDANHGDDTTSTVPAAGQPAGAAVRGDRGAVPSRGRITALGIADRIEAEGSQALIGQQADTADALAELAQVYRDPRYETFRVFLTKGGQIIHATGVSARLPGQAPMIPAGMTPQQYLAWFKDQMAATGADGYYILHNHPSGDPTPSTQDLAMTRSLSANVPGMLGHVVINSNRYAVISPDGGDVRHETKDFGEDMLLKASKPSPVLGKQIAKSDDLVVLGKSMQKPGWLTIIGTDSPGKVRVVAEAPAAILNKNYPALAAMARRLSRKSGARSLYLVGEDGDVNSLPVMLAIERGVLRDAVGTSGRSMSKTIPQQSNDFAKTPGRFVAEDAPLYERLQSSMTKQALTDKLGDLFQSSKTFNWWHRTLGTQFHKAKVNPLFGRVYRAAQAFINDTSFVANEAADQAPDLLPKLDQLSDITKRLKLSAEDQKAVAAAVFQGTLADQQVYADADLRAKFKLTDEQIKLYRQFRAAVDTSLDYLVAGEVVRYLGRQMEELPQGLAKMVSDGRLVEFSQSVRKAVQAVKDDADTRLVQLRKQHQRERDNLNARWRRALEGPAGRAGTRLATDSRFEEELNELKRSQGGERKRAEDKAVLWENVQFEIAEKFEKIETLKSQGYAPLMRFGRYTVDVTAPSGMPGQPADRLYFGMYDTQAEANAAARKLRKEFEDYEPEVSLGVASQEAYKLFAGLNPETLAIFGEHAGLENKELFEQYIKLAASNRSALTRLIQRKGIAGYSEDVSRVLAAFITSNARATSANIHMGELDEAVDAVPKQHGDVRDEAQRLRDYVRNPADEAAKIRGLMFMHFLGGSVASAAVNMTQPFAMSFPWLSQYGGPAKAAKSLVHAIKETLAGTTDEGLKQALHKAEADGVVSPSEIHQLQAEASRNLGNSPALRKGVFLWGSLFQLAEKFNRKVTFIAAYRTARELGRADAFEFAANAVDETQGVYSKANRPNWARGAVGATAFTFKQYSISYMEFLARLPKREKALALAVLVLLAGLQGLPGADDLDDIIDTLGQRLGGYDTNSKRWKQQLLASVFGEQGAEFAMRGVSVGMPLDVAGRLGIGNLIPGTGLLRKDKTDKSGDVAELAGPIASMATDALKGLAALGEGKPLEALSSVAPGAVKNALKALDMASTGAYRDGRGRKVVDADSMDVFVKALGFQPSGVAAEQRRLGAIQQSISLAKITEGEIAGRWAEGVFDQDQAKIAEARQALQDWNRKNPDARIAINMAQVLRRVREMRTSKEQRIVKSAPKEMRGAVLTEVKKE